jgi:hypothetical protein
MGRVALEEKAASELLSIATEINEQKWGVAGGIQAFESLPQEEQDHLNKEASESFTLEAGWIAQAKLTPEDKVFFMVTVWVWGGCCMHKDMNVFKAVVVGLQGYWAANGLKGPMPLHNIHGAAAIHNMEDGTDPATFAEREAMRCVECGGDQANQIRGPYLRPEWEKLEAQARNARTFLVRRKDGLPICLP